MFLVGLISECLGQKQWDIMSPTSVDRLMVKEAIRLFGPFGPLGVMGAICGVLGGLATAWLLMAINQGLHTDGSLDRSFFVSFALLCLFSGGGTALAGAINTAVGQKMVSALRKDMASRILRAPLPAIETAGNHRLIAAISNDVDTVSSFMFNFPSYVISFAIAVGSFGYLLFLSWPSFLIVAISMVIGIILNTSAHKGWLRDYGEIREVQDALYKQYRSITEGAKELKVNRQRRIRVFDEHISGTVDRISFLRTRAMRQYWVTDGAASTLFFVVICLLLLGKNWLGIGSSEISGAVLVLLYVKGPVEQIAAALPVLDQARISFRRVIAFSAEFSSQEQNIAIGGHPPSSGAVGQPFRSIELRDVSYSYPSKDGAPSFAVGPINLSIAAGQIVFIVGDNGSGKTTLLKLMLGLYQPQTGQIVANGAQISADIRDEYRQLFACVFSDFYLFEDLVGEKALPDQLERYLDRLEMRNAVSVRDGSFSTLDLSAGQRKRLALVHAFVEDRPIIVTDEWAADQDPNFRRVFYQELLPDLKRNGKTLIVISHDDRYFSVADRILQMSNGRIVEERDAANV
jgi:putative ATP-binding cassette transporter